MCLRTLLFVYTTFNTPRSCSGKATGLATDNRLGFWVEKLRDALNLDQIINQVAGPCE